MVAMQRVLLLTALSGFVQSLSMQSQSLQPLTEAAFVSGASAVQSDIHSPLLGPIKIKDADSCIDAAQRNTDGGKVHMVACNKDNQNQQWGYHFDTLLIKNQYGKCLDCYEAKNEGSCHIMTCNPDNNNQRFDYDPATGLIKGHSSSRCLDNPVREAGGKVYVFDCNANNQNQQFTIGTPETNNKYFGDQVMKGADEVGVGYFNHANKNSPVTDAMVKDCNVECIGSKCKRHCIQSKLHGSHTIQNKADIAASQTRLEKEEADVDAEEEVLKEAQNEEGYNKRKHLEWKLAYTDQHALDKATLEVHQAIKGIADTEKEVAAATTKEDAAAAKLDEAAAKLDAHTKELKLSEAQLNMDKGKLTTQKEVVASLTTKLGNAKKAVAVTEAAIAAGEKKLAAQKQARDAHKSVVDKHEAAVDKAKEARLGATKKLEAHTAVKEGNNLDHLKKKAKDSHGIAKSK